MDYWNTSFAIPDLARQLEDLRDRDLLGVLDGYGQAEWAARMFAETERVADLAIGRNALWDNLQELDRVADLAMGRNALWENLQELDRVADLMKGITPALQIAEQVDAAQRRLALRDEVRDHLTLLEQLEQGRDRLIELEGEEVEEERRIWLPAEGKQSVEEALSNWKVPGRSLLVEAGTVPRAIFEDLSRAPDLLLKLDPRQFELAMAEVLRRKGYDSVVLTPRSGDGGKDIIAGRTDGGISLVVYVECKQLREGRPLRLSDLRALFGVVQDDRVNKGLLLTTGRITAKGREFVSRNRLLDAKDYHELVAWMGVRTGR